MIAMKSTRMIVNLTAMIALLCGSMVGCSPDERQDSCLRTFDSFAYDVGNGIYEMPAHIIYPNSPWKMVAEAPIYQRNDVVIYSSSMEFIKDVGEGQDLWVLHTIKENSSVTSIIEIYHSKTKLWDSISGRIENTDLFVSDLFLTENGDVWGKVTSSDRKNDNGVDSVQLSKYDEKKQKFELVKNTEVSWTDDISNSRKLSLILYDKNSNKFWMLFENLGIFSYEINGGKLRGNLSISDFPITDAVLDRDEIILQVLPSAAFSQEHLFQLTNGSVLTYDIQTNSLKAVEVPREPWPRNSGLLVDKNGNLWLGSIGYRTKDDQWHLQIPDKNSFFGSAGDEMLAPPRILFQSSDGRLWFSRDIDGNYSASGIAWYDNDAKSGCQISNSSGSIVENSLNQIWLLMDGKIFTEKR